MVFQEMEPVIGSSVTRIGDDKWSLGTCKFCEKFTGPAPADAQATWTDQDNSTFCIRPHNPPISTPPPGDPSVDKYHEAGAAEACWSLGARVVVEVWAWTEDMPLESDRLAFVKKHAPSVPLPNVILNWVDRGWNREYFVRYRPERSVLVEDAWLDMSKAQVRGIVKQVVEHCSTLAKLTSPTVEDGTGHGTVADGFLFGEREKGLPIPHWKPYILPKLTAETVRVMLGAKCPKVRAPIVDKEKGLVFTHYCLAPTVVFIEKPDMLNGTIPRVTCIVEWRYSGFMPHWWQATKVQHEGMYAVEKDVPGKWAWGRTLGQELELAGFEEECEWYRKALRYELNRMPREFRRDILTRKQRLDRNW